MDQWVISPTYKWGIPWGEITHLLTIDPNFLKHPSKPSGGHRFLPCFRSIVTGYSTRFWTKMLQFSLTNRPPFLQKGMILRRKTTHPLHPPKTDGWNLKITQISKGKSCSKPPCFGFQPTFRGSNSTNHRTAS